MSDEKAPTAEERAGVLYNTRPPFGAVIGSGAWWNWAFDQIEQQITAAEQAARDEADKRAIKIALSHSIHPGDVASDIVHAIRRHQRTQEPSQ